MEQNRALRILAFPVLAVMFLVGSALYSVGASHQGTKKLPRKAAPPKESASLEMGLLTAEAEEAPLPVRN